MSGCEFRLPTSIYDEATTRRRLGEGIEVAVIEGGGYLRVRLPGPTGSDAAALATLRENLNQVLRASIEARLPVLRAEDE